jgi:hypothetical protein
MILFVLFCLSTELRDPLQVDGVEHDFYSHSSLLPTHCQVTGPGFCDHPSHCPLQRIGESELFISSQGVTQVLLCTSAN